MVQILILVITTICLLVDMMSKVTYRHSHGSINLIITIFEGMVHSLGI